MNEIPFFCKNFFKMNAKEKCNIISKKKINSSHLIGLDESNEVIVLFF
jgi:hypothetical protein